MQVVIVARDPLAFLAERAAAIEPAAQAVRDDNFVPKCALSLDGGHIGDCQVEAFDLVGDIGADDGRRIRIECRFGPGLDAHDRPDISAIARLDLGIMDEQGLPVGVGIVDLNARRVKDDPALCARLVSAYTSTREHRIPSRHAEERLYDGFPDSRDEARMLEFHETNWADRLPIVQSLDNERLRFFGLRLLYFEARSVLPEALRLELERALSGRLVDTEAGGLTLEQALRAIDETPSDDASDAGALLADYRSYLVGRMERVADFRAKQFAI